VDVWYTNKVNTQQVVTTRGHRCGDIELGTYRTDSPGPVPLVLDLCITYGHILCPLTSNFKNQLQEGC